MRLFCYGTLKGAGKDTHYVNGKLYSVGFFPAIILNGEKRIAGQILNVTELELQHLDRYEGVPDLYTRERTTAFSLEDGAAEEVWVYQWARGIEELEEIDGWKL